MMRECLLGNKRRAEETTSAGRPSMDGGIVAPDQ